MQSVRFAKVVCATLIVLLGVGLGVALPHLIAAASGQVDTARAFAPPQALTPRVWIPVVMKNYPPPHASKSRYMQTTDPVLLYNMGCNEGHNTPDNANVIVVLDFGSPAFSGTYGTRIFDSNNQFRSTYQISESVKQYLKAFYFCAPPNAYLNLVVGTSNNGSRTTTGHGIRWARMVNDLNNWIQIPPSYASKVVARGGIDIEQDPTYGWSSPAATRNWVNGYNSVSSGTSRYYNYGSCDSCPFTACPACVPPGGWTVEDIWYVSFGVLSAYPLPEIYLRNGVNADQWYRMSLYGYTNHGGARILIEGTLTQWQACQDVGGPCVGTTDNKPEQGWAQLQDALNADTRTAQAVRWSTDITWQGQ